MKHLCYKGLRRLFGQESTLWQTGGPELDMRPIFKEKHPDLVAHIDNPIAGEHIGYPGLQSQFQVRQGHTETLHLEKQKTSK